jgi:hypothetical protein
MTPWSFYIHCVVAVVILVADYYNKLEPAFNAFEMKIGLYTPADTTDYETPPFYVPPMESIKIDSNMAIK